MKTRNRVLASIGALALMASTVLPSLASTSSAADDAKVNVSVTGIEGATVSISIEESAANGFDNVTYNYSAATPSNGAFVVTVTDSRGTAAGWSVTLEGTDFIRANTSVGQNIGIGQLSLQPATPTLLSTAGTLPNPLPGIATMSSSPSPFWSADVNEGDGVFQSVVDGTLLVPAGTLVDEYESTITAVITFAP
jgi:hypothetical protein